MKLFRETRSSFRSCATAVLALALASLGIPSLAQKSAWTPERSVRLVIPYAPSGAVDVTARFLAKELSDLWGQTVVVENKPGAAGLIGADTVAKAPGDGYTLLLTDDGVLTTLPLFQEKMPYDTMTDLVPVAMAGMFPYVIVAHASLKAKSLQEVVALAKARPGAIDYATNGIGGTHHLSWERLQRAAGIKLNHIPFKSAAPALQEVLSGRVAIMMLGVSTAFPHIKDGRLVSLATGGLKRSPFLPQLPTVAESGFPGFEVVAWMAVLAPKGTPPALVEKISADLNKVTRSKSYAESLAQRGSESRTSTARELAERMRTEYERTRALIKSLGLKAN
ncbi:MAG: tripartite tricarboxylate transporter substrate binding protein [Betaproteobacteria bacterium]|nr:tripartite tricarboxylate transporter substrate binding protein [Betaproteobacteria bacterium]